MDPLIDVFDTKAMHMLRQELIDMDENAFPPDSPVRPGETPIEVLSVPLRKLYALGKGYQRRMEQFMIDFKWASQSDRLKTWPLGKELMDKTSLLNMLLWTAIKDQYGLWDQLLLGIRDGWIIVKKPKSNTFEDILDALGWY